ncbi:MAG: YraN family protein [Candidatus Omnitrophota bacterium]|nr:YraN family protein [Candidatus Omnitrophota bacterium]
MTVSVSEKETHLSLGRRGEEIACAFLTRNGYSIEARNYRCRMGEIDVVATRRGFLAFVEIKTRRGDRFGRPEEAVHRLKQRKLIQLAQWYLKATKTTDCSVAFDVVAVSFREEGEPEIRLIQDAFDAGAGIR